MRAWEITSSLCGKRQHNRVFVISPSVFADARQSCSSAPGVSTEAYMQICHSRLSLAITSSGLEGGSQAGPTNPCVRRLSATVRMPDLRQRSSPTSSPAHFQVLISIQNRHSVDLSLLSMECRAKLLIRNLSTFQGRMSEKKDSILAPPPFGYQRCSLNSCCNASEGNGCRCRVPLEKLTIEAAENTVAHHWVLPSRHLSRTVVSTRLYDSSRPKGCEDRLGANGHRRSA